MADSVRIFQDAARLATAPLTIRTPGAAWAYAASLPLERVGGAESVVEVLIRVVEGRVGVSCARTGYDVLVDELEVCTSQAPTTLKLLPEPGVSGFLLVRNGPDAAPGTVEIHSLKSRPFTAHERAALASVRRLEPIRNWNRYYGTPGESMLERKRLRDYEGLSAPRRVPWIDGLTAVMYPNDQLSRAVYVSGLYEPNTAIALRRFLSPGATFVDVGAHAGVFTMLGSRWVGETGRVYAFEPSPRERARLEEHVALNGLDNVTVFPQAVSDRQGKAMLRIAAARYSGLNTLGARFAYDGVESIETLRVDVTTLDAFVCQARLARLDAIKLDIEGAELTALRGGTEAVRRFRPALVIEMVATALQANGSTLAELQEWLASANYHTFRIDDGIAALESAPALQRVDDQNIVALPAETSEAFLSS